MTTQAPALPVKQPRPIIGILCVILALSAPVIQILVAPILAQQFSDNTARFLSLGVFWAITGIVLAVSYVVEGIPLSRFGFRQWNKPLRAKLIELILAVLTAFVIAVITIGFSLAIRNQLSQPLPRLNPANIRPFWLMFAAWVTAAFTEEVLFRSYAIERLLILNSRRWIAAVITILVFTLLHLFAWDWIHVLTLVFPGSLLLTLVYFWRRSLLFVVIIHAIMNIQILFLPLLAPYL